ncbi:hypothetical protein GOEFS_055_00110 [Gordonia effusa NBRC 100432]|uniref:Lipoprotein n=1 Tax=Gordonia effusa NBRC 100432 TaxID=1077974 RepID=H0R097_9ACTN|nr:hypothetical protein [Gordonia effusa]GAB18498.1 hypothetical protein GOEFS_055_00110 [Gordonia effusa NBRC 100432]
MSVHTLSKRRLSSAFAIAAVGFGVVLSSTACSAGQVSQSANQAAAINGASVNFDQLALRDVQILYPASKSDEVFGNGGPFKVAFVISNNSPDHYYRLDKITAPQGTVEIENSVGDRVISPGGALRAGSPVGLLTAEADNEKRLVVTLRDAGKTVAAGLTTKLRFTFSKASVIDKDKFTTVTGDVVADTPVDVGTYATRVDQPRQAEEPEGGEH